MLNSHWYAMKSTKLPMMMTNTTRTKVLLDAFPEIKEHFGDDVELAIKIDAILTGEHVVSIKKDKGIGAGY